MLAKPRRISANGQRARGRFGPGAGAARNAPTANRNFMPVFPHFEVIQCQQLRERVHRGKGNTLLKAEPIEFLARVPLEKAL